MRRCYASEGVSMIDIEALKVGDVVQLVSGSPYMTVRGFKEVSHAAAGRSREYREPRGADDEPEAA